jgi:hypothetical protein
MDDKIKNIIISARSVRLSPSERAEARAALHSYMQFHPVRNMGAIRHIGQETSKSPSLTIFRSYFKPMTIALIIAVLIGGGASFAAEGALPGDWLYPVKISVNEEVRSFVAFSDEAQARWDARRAERRLEEAAELAAEGKLDAEARVKAEARFSAHAQDFEDRVEKIESADNDADASVKLITDFETSLKVREQALVNIVEEGDAEVKVQVEPLLIEVRNKIETATRSRGVVQLEVPGVNINIDSVIDGDVSSSSGADSGADQQSSSSQTEVRTEVNAGVNTGGNSGGSINTGDSSATIKIQNNVNANSGSDSTTIEIGTDGAVELELSQ